MSTSETSTAMSTSIEISTFTPISMVVMTAGGIPSRPELLRVVAAGLAGAVTSAAAATARLFIKGHTLYIGDSENHRIRTMQIQADA
jgi:hypothetical protein